jgi:hypothetical protein
MNALRMQSQAGLSDSGKEEMSSSLVNSKDGSVVRNMGDTGEVRSR